MGGTDTAGASEHSGLNLTLQPDFIFTVKKGIADKYGDWEKLPW
jgi:hypothetical protein